MFESDVDDFLEVIEAIKLRIEYLLEKSALAEEEKQFILNHIVVVPGPDYHHFRNDVQQSCLKDPGEELANE